MATPASTNLEALIQACAAGDRNAFRALYDATSGRLYGGALRLLRDPMLAQDALQEGYLKIWRNAAKFDANKGAPLSWMGIIVRRAALDRLATIRTHVDLNDIDVAAPVFVPRDPGLDKCLAKLPDLHRKSLILSYVYEYSHEEIAAMLQKPVGTIKSWIRRAGLAMRECLEA